MTTQHDKEYLILAQIDANPDTTQRDLSRHTGLSLGSVNLLLKKMANEGLVKVESIPAHRVAYMLTPRGMVEKANKTVNYIKRHYNAINQTKENIKTVITTLLADHPTLYILRTQDEVGNLVVTAVEEMPPTQTTAINFIHTMEEATGSHIPVVHCVPDESLAHMGYANPTINLLEKL